MALNPTQTYILKSYVDMTLGDLISPESDIPADKDKAYTTLALIIAPKIEESQHKLLVEWGKAAAFDDIHKVFTHTHPQDSYTRGGLLGLSSKNLEEIDPVSKDDVVEYVCDTIYSGMSSLRDGGATFVPEMMVLDDNVRQLINDRHITEEDAAALCRTDPDRFTALTATGVMNLMSYANIDMKKTAEMYDTSPEKLRVLSSINVLDLMKEARIGLDHVSDMYDVSPEKLDAVSTYGVYELMQHHNVSYEAIEEIYDASPEKLKYMSDYNTLAVMDNYNVDAPDISILYDYDKDALDAFVERRYNENDRETILQLIAQAKCDMDKGFVAGEKRRRDDRESLEPSKRS